MKRLFLATFLALPFAVGSALAADLPSRAPPPPVPVMAAPPIFTWTGFMQVAKSVTTGAIPGPRISSAGPTFVAGTNVGAFNLGGFGGYRYQFDNDIVVGIEGDLAWLNGRGRANYVSGPVPAGVDGVQRLNLESGVRGSLGYAMGRGLAFVDGGASLAHESGCAVISGGSSACGLPGSGYGGTRTGWTIGAGYDYAFTNNLIGRVEYRYADYGSHSYVTPGVGSGTTTSLLQTNTILTGLEWKF